MVVALGLVAGTVALLRGWDVKLPAWRPEFPPPPAAVRPADDVAFEDFVGAEACKDCHEAEYAAWRVSTHGRAGGTPSRALVIAPFNGRPIRFVDAVVTPTVSGDGRFQFTVLRDGHEPEVLTVTGVVGGGHMVGGGTQGFVSRYPDGTVRFLPFDFARRESTWFCNTNTRTDQGWVPITPDMSLEECADWPPVRILGTEPAYGNCQECHTALTELTFDEEEGRYSTRVFDFAIQCESCHGPMAAHVELTDTARHAPGGDLGVRALATLDKDESLGVCFRCHALKDVMQPGYLPGKPFEDYYSIGFPLLGAKPLHPDGRVRTFAYQGNHRFSDCYLDGSMTCVDCHDPHSQKYRDIRGRVIEDRFADEQCTDCHASKAGGGSEHTFHEPGTPGSRCVSCHMPYLQHPELGDKIRFARSDHTIAIPRPNADASLGIVNACAQAGCHDDTPVTELEAWTRRWWGEIKPRKPIVEAQLHPMQLGDELAATPVLLDSAAAHPAAQVAALGLFVSRYLLPNMRRLDPKVEDALRALAGSEDLDVRGAALAALHLARGENRGTRGFLVRVLRRASGEDLALRARWVMALATYGDMYLKRTEYAYAVATYRKALELRPGDPAILRNEGLAQAYAGDFQDAVESLRRSVEADPRAALSWVNLGFALGGLGDATAAEDAYRHAVEITDDEALAHFNLGNALLRRGDVVGAIARYERALELQPTMTQAYAYLARAYGGLQDTARVLDVARRWRRFAPDDPQPLQLLRQIEGG